MILRTESQTQSETIRAAVENPQTAMNGYKSLLKESTEQRIIKFGGIIAEACFFISDAFNLLRSTDESVRNGGIWRCKRHICRRSLTELLGHLWFTCSLLLSY
jgi:hypothetical protein